MVSIPITPQLYDLLMEEDFPLPEECKDITLSFPVDGMIEITYKCNLTKEHLVSWGRVMQRLGELP